MLYYVEIKNLETGEVVKRMGSASEHNAELIEMGVLRQLDTERYCVGMVPVKQSTGGGISDSARDGLLAALKEH